MKLEEYHTAKAALEMGASLSQDASRFTKLIEECEKFIAGLHSLQPLSNQDKVSLLAGCL